MHLRVLALVFLSTFVGCQRGCLLSWMEARGVGPTAHGVPGRDLAVGGGGVGEVDCSDGLARCLGGMVEVSLAYRYPEPCNGPPERCICPWERVEECSRGCAADGLEEVIPRALAAEQLCAPASTLNLARPPSPDAVAPSSCDGDSYFCSESSIIACGPPNRVVAICLHGCAQEVEALFDDTVTSDAAIAILCRRR